jgi:putative PIN family toxin of toxin-antitoxin system
VRIVIDTNVLISAIFWTGKPKQLLNKVRHRKVTFITSENLLAELKEILMRKDKPFRLSDEEAGRIFNEIRTLAETVPTHSKLDVCQDERDNKVIECALDGKAECIISGDLHLLELESFRGVRIMTVSDFLNDFERLR